MISLLEGPVIAAGTEYLILKVGGIGLRVEVPASVVTSFSGGVSSGASVQVHTSLVVREDSLTLFGFQSSGDRDVFETLLSVSGIGPRLALAAINELGVNGLRVAVANQDLGALSRIPGVGKKTAQRMTLEIGDKLGPMSAGDENRSTSNHEAGMRESVEAGLEQLGYPRAVAQRAVDALDGDYTDIGEMIRDALVVARDGRLGV